MKTKLLTLLSALACVPVASAQISGTITGNTFYDQRVYLSGNLTINGTASFGNGVDMAAGSAAATLTVSGNTTIAPLVGTTTSALRSVVVTGQLDLNGPVVCSNEMRVVGPMIARKGTTKISAGSITITGDLTLPDEMTLILETNGGDVTLGGNIHGPANASMRGTLVISARNGGVFRFTGTRDSSVTLSTSTGSSVGAPLYPVNMSILTTISGTPLTIGFVISNPDGGSGSVTSRFLIRAIGPGLARFTGGGVADDPKLTVNGTPSITIDDWSTDPTNKAAVQDAMDKTGAFQIDVGSKDAAVVVDVPPGALTVSVSTVAGSKAGSAIIEVYRVP